MRGELSIALDVARLVEHDWKISSAQTVRRVLHRSSYDCRRLVESMSCQIAIVIATNGK